MVDTTLSDADIAARIRHGRRCPIPQCREDRAGSAAICPDHRDELARMLNPGYVGERDLERAASIPVLWARLDPSPGRGDPNDRRAPGFRSSPPLNLTTVVMRDPRSVGYPVVPVWHELLPGTNLVNWDDPHYEDESPPRSVEKAIGAIVEAVWDEVPVHGVEAQCAFLHTHLGVLAGRDDAGELYANLWELHDQLRRAAGDPRPKPVASCTGWIRDHTGAKIECEAPLYAPPPDPGVAAGRARPPKLDPAKPVLRCRRCDRPYTSAMLIRQQIGAQRAS